MAISVTRHLAIAALLTTLLPGLFAETRWVAGDGQFSRIGIFFDFDFAPSPASVAAMRREVGAVMALAGAQLSWVLLSAQAATTTFDDLAVLRFRGNCRAVKLDAEARADVRMTLGETEVAARRVTAYSDVECDQIQSCLGGILSSFCPRDRDEAFGRAMGRVAAHELYHIFGRTTKHTHSGDQNMERPSIL